MNTDVDTFTDKQREFVGQIVSDFGGPTSTASVLMVLETAIYTLKPDIDLSRPEGESEKALWADLEACMAALQYWKVQQIKDA
jgi:hypothetical protein